MANHYKGRTTEIKIRCTPEDKEALVQKLLSSGFVSAKGECVPDFAEFLPVLANKSLRWFQRNFKKKGLTNDSTWGTTIFISKTKESEL